jgi:DNA polymerase V
MSRRGPSEDDLPDGAAVGGDRTATSTAPAPTASAGFGSPGSDQTVRRLDLNDAFIRHPQATFVMRANGDAMVAAGIASGDVLLVDRSIAAWHGHIVIAALDGELVCRRLVRQGGVVALETAQPRPTRQVCNEEQPLEVWGVVTTVIKSLPV